MKLVREVASFLQMYQGYTLHTALEMYAVSFFRLLDEGYRLKYQEYRMMANIVSVPDMKEMDRKAFLRQLDYASKSPDEVFNSGDNTIEDAKQLFRKL